MMEEVSITVAYDAHIIDQMSEEEILASLVVETLPKKVVSSAAFDLIFVTCWFKPGMVEFLRHSTIACIDSNVFTTMLKY